MKANKDPYKYLDLDPEGILDNIKKTDEEAGKKKPFLPGDEMEEP